MNIPTEVDNERVFWEEEFNIIGESLILWNENVVPWMHGIGLVAKDKRNQPEILKRYKSIAHKLATSRGWHYELSTDSYAVDSITETEKQTVMDELARRETAKNDDLYEAI